MSKCPRLCGSVRDGNLWFERELATFLRTLLSLVIEPSSLLPEFEVMAVLRLRINERMPVDKVRLQALFGQYFRFDVSSQSPFFFKEVQNFLQTVCETGVSDFDQGWVKHLSLLPFDPCLIQSGSMDRLTDFLVRTVSVLSFGGLCSSDSNDVIVQQYRKVVAYLKRRWESSSSLLPVIVEAVSLSLSYPSWDRCRELHDVLKIMFARMLHDSYRADFVDIGNTALEKEVMLSSLNVVRSWMSTGFSGHIVNRWLDLFDIVIQLMCRCLRLP